MSFVYFTNMPGYEYGTAMGITETTGHLITFGSTDHVLTFRPIGGWRPAQTELGTIPRTIEIAFQITDENHNFVITTPVRNDNITGDSGATDSRGNTVEVVDISGTWTLGKFGNNQSCWSAMGETGSSIRIRFTINTAITEEPGMWLSMHPGSPGYAPISYTSVIQVIQYIDNGNPTIETNRTVVYIHPRSDACTYVMSTQEASTTVIDRIVLTPQTTSNPTIHWEIGSVVVKNPDGVVVGYGSVEGYPNSYTVVRMMDGVYTMDVYMESDENPYAEGTTTSDTPDTTYPTNYIAQFSSGFYKIFVPTQTQLASFVNHLYSQTFIDSIKNLWNSVINIDDLIVGARIIPGSPTIAGTATPKVGWVEATGITMNYTNNQYITISLGSITIGRVWNSYLDFAPYTRVTLTLPFIGERELSTNDVMGKSITLSYNIDLMSGECVAYVSVDGNVHYQFTGNASYQIPISSTDVGNMLLQPIKSIAGLALAVGGVATGNPMLIGAGGALGATVSEGTEEGIANVQVPGLELSSPTTKKIDNLSGNSGYMSILKPYVCIERAIPDINAGFGHANGYQCNKYLQLQTCAGYTKVSEIHLENISCTTEELTKIEALLKGGVIL